MALNDVAYAAIHKKDTLLRKDWPRFAVRAILAGVYLTLGAALQRWQVKRLNQLYRGMAGELWFLLASSA